MKAFIIAAAALMVACTPANPSVEYLFNQSGLAKNDPSSENVQGCAVYSDWFFSFRDGGYCVVSDLRDSSLVAEFPMGSFRPDNHANIAFFSTQRFEDWDVLPMLCLSQVKGDRLCFIERILTDSDGKPCGSELKHVLVYNPREWNSRMWIADEMHPEDLYCFGNTVGNKAEGNRIIIQKFRTPDFSTDDFEIVLSEDDVVETLYFDQFLPEGARGPQNTVMQGAFVYDYNFILPVGAGSEKNPSEIFVANLKSGKSAAFDVTDVLPCEMEDFALWGDRIVCPTNASKGYSPVFAFRLKDLVL